MAIIVHGPIQSTCVQRVVTVLKELNIPYELQPVDFAKGEHKSPAYLEKQPFGQVPYIEDGSFILYESRAIARYLVLKYGKGSKLVPQLVPGDEASIQRVALFEQASSIETSNFDPFASGIYFEKVAKPVFMGVQPDGARVADLKQKLEGKLQGYERILGERKYLAGDEVTLADLAHLPYGSGVSEKLGMNIFATPNLARWWKDISSRESWTAIVNETK